MYLLTGVTSKLNLIPSEIIQHKLKFPFNAKIFVLPFKLNLIKSKICCKTCLRNQIIHEIEV